MSITYAVILGVVQGITEFLPISSSAHLVIVPLFLKRPYQGLTFDVALHCGTLLALLIYFFKDWVLLLKNAFFATKSTQGRLFWYIMLSNLPAIIIGFKLETIAETVLRNPLVISLALFSGSIILWLSDKKTKSQKEIENMSFKESLVIGLAQAAAIIPGISRSGATIAAGLFLNLKRESAAKFSFLLATPVIFGAGLLRISKLEIGDLNINFFTGVFSSAIASVISINFLIKYLKRHNLNIFIWYRFFLGITIILLILSGIM